MADPVIPEDIAYTIMTGYYPEIASRLEYGGKKTGKGRVGAKNVRKRGFSESSVAREKVSMMDEAMKQAMSMNPELFDPTGLTSLKNIGFDAETEKFKYKFMGGSEHYKLYGDQVWFMAGVRDKKEMVTDFLQDTNKMGVQYQQIYKDAQPHMIKEAVAFAERVFDAAWDTAKIQEHIDGASIDSAEEIGFSDGDYDWMTVDEAVKRGYLQKRSEYSKANERDLVKYNRTTKEIEATADVTEMSIAQHGQHGIIEPPKELKDAIKNIEKGDEAPNKAALKQQVISLYTKQIENDYNPMIKRLKHIAGLGHNVKKVKKPWDKVLKAVSSKKSGKAGAPDIAKAVGVTMNKYHFLDTIDKSRDQTTVEFIAHMLGTLNKKTNVNFAQGHRVATLPSGRKIYASVPLKTSPSTLLFLKGPLARTRIIEGASYSTAIHYGQSQAGLEKGKATSRSAKHAYTRSKTGTTNTVANTNAGSANANMNLRKGLLPATSVSIPAGEKLTKELNKLIQGVGTAGLTIKKIGASSDMLKKQTYGMKRGKLKYGAGNAATAGFWALPYIGVMQSEFEE